VKVQSVEFTGWHIGCREYTEEIELRVRQDSRV